MTSTYSLNVLIVEDQLIIAETLKQMLIDLGYQCVAIVDSFDQGKIAVQSDNFDLAILDINLEGGREGIQLGEQCFKLGKPFLFLTSYSDPETVQAAKVAKPGAYLVKPFTPQDILVAMEMTMMHCDAISDSQFDQVLNRLELSERERQVLTCLKDKMTNSAISQKLFVSSNTVKFHIKNLYVKLAVTNRTELMNKLHEQTTKTR